MRNSQIWQGIHGVPTCISQNYGVVGRTLFVVPLEGGKGSAESPAAGTAIAQHAPFPTRNSQVEYSPAITDPAVFAPSPPGNPAFLFVWPPSGRISARTRERAAAATGTAPPAGDYGVGSSWGSSTIRPACYDPAASSTAATASGCRYSPCCYRLACPDGTNPVRPRPRRAPGYCTFYYFRRRQTYRPSQRPTRRPLAHTP